MVAMAAQIASAATGSAADDVVEDLEVAERSPAVERRDHSFGRGDFLPSKPLPREAKASIASTPCQLRLKVPSEAGKLCWGQAEIGPLAICLLEENQLLHVSPVSLTAELDRLLQCPQSGAVIEQALLGLGQETPRCDTRRGVSHILPQAVTRRLQVGNRLCGRCPALKRYLPRESLTLPQRISQLAEIRHHRLLVPRPSTDEFLKAI